MTKPASLLYSTNITIVQHKHHYCTAQTSLLYSTNTRKYQDWKASVWCLLFNPQNGDLLWQSSSVWVQLDTSFFRYLYFKEKIWNKNRWIAHRLDQSTRAIPRGGYRARFFSQWFLHFIKHTKPTKEDPVILVLDGHCSHTRNLEVITLVRENRVDVICLPPHSNHKMQSLDKDFMGPLKHILLPRNWKMVPLKPRASCHCLPNWRNIRKCIQASCNRRNST